MLRPAPHRIQRRRTKDWRMPVWCVSVTRPGVLGNPFTGPDAIEQFRQWLDAILIFQPLVRMPDHMEVAARMRDIAASGLSVACFCPIGKPCHGDVILEYAAKIRAGWKEWIEAERLRGVI